VNVLDSRCELVGADGARKRLEMEPLGAEELVRAGVDVLEEEDLDSILGKRRFVHHPAACTAAAAHRLARRRATWQGARRTPEG
jgi:hypothetical protein